MRSDFLNEFSQSPIFSIRQRYTATLYFCCFVIFELLGVYIAFDNPPEAMPSMISMSTLAVLMGLLPGIVEARYRADIYHDHISVRRFVKWSTYFYSEITGYEYADKRLSNALYLFSDNDCVLKLSYAGDKKSIIEIEKMLDILLQYGIPLVFRSADRKVKHRADDATIRLPKIALGLAALCFSFGMLGVYVLIVLPYKMTTSEFFSSMIFTSACLIACPILVTWYRIYKLVIGPETLVLYRIFQPPLVIPYSTITKAAVTYINQTTNQAAINNSTIDLFTGKKRLLNVRVGQAGYIALAFQLAHKQVPLIYTPKNRI